MFFSFKILKSKHSPLTPLANDHMCNIYELTKPLYTIRQNNCQAQIQNRLYQPPPGSSPTMGLLQSNLQANINAVICSIKCELPGTQLKVLILCLYLLQLLLPRALLVCTYETVAFKEAVGIVSLIACHKI